MICLEESTQKIQAWSCGLQKIKTQNWTRKLKKSLQANYVGKPRSVLVDPSTKFSLSKAYQKFLKENPSYIFLHKDHKFNSTITEKFRRELLDLPFENTLLLEAVQNHSNIKGRSFKFLIENYI